MKALVYTQPHQLEYRDHEVPLVGPGEVLFRVGAVGICGSDMHAFQGHDARRPAPLILGHEAAGTVVGGPNDGLNAVVNPLVTCGRCDACLCGRSNLCAQREIISMAPRQGAFAEFLAIPERNLVAIPAGMEMPVAALTEPMATAWHGVTVAAKSAQRPLAECRALVFGGGAVGLSSALVLWAQGCRDILLAETNVTRHETANRTGVCSVFDPSHQNLAADNTIDVVIDCVGGMRTRQGASAAVRPGGVIVHVGLLDANDGLDIRKLTLQEISFTGTYTYTMQDFQATVAAMHRGALGDLDWFEKRPLEAGCDAFTDLFEGRIASAKVVLVPEA